MGEFEAITSQEQLDGILKDRLARKDAQSEKAIAELKAQYSDYDDLKGKAQSYEQQVTDLTSALEEANKRLAGHKTEIEERDRKIKEYETASKKASIAREFGLSFDSTQYLQGDDDESIRKSAEGLRALIGRTHHAPMASGEPAGGDETNSRTAMRQMVKSFNFGGN